MYEVDKQDELISTLHKLKYELKDNDEVVLVPIYLRLANVFHQKSNFDSLQYWNQKAKVLIKPYSPYYGDYLLCEAWKSSFDGNYSYTIKKILEAIKIFEEKDDLENLAIAFNGLAFNHGKIGNIDFQIKYLLKAITINKALGKTAKLAFNYNNLGTAYKSQNKLKEALDCYNLAFEELIKLNNPMLMAQNLTNRANVYEKREDYKKAEELYLACEKVCKENNIEFGVMLSSINLGNIYRFQKKYSLSEEKLKLGLKLAKQLKTISEESIAYQLLSNLAKDKGDFKNAFEYQSRYHKLNDSLVSQSVKKLKNLIKNTKQKKRSLKSLNFQEKNCTRSCLPYYFLWGY